MLQLSGSLAVYMWCKFQKPTNLFVLWVCLRFCVYHLQTLCVGGVVERVSMRQVVVYFYDFLTREMLWFYDKWLDLYIFAFCPALCRVVAPDGSPAVKSGREKTVYVLWTLYGIILIKGNLGPQQ